MTAWPGIVSASGALSSRSICSGPAAIVADDVYMNALTEGASVATLNRSRVLFTITSSYVLASQFGTNRSHATPTILLRMMCGLHQLRFLSPLDSPNSLISFERSTSAATLVNWESTYNAPTLLRTKKLTPPPLLQELIAFCQIYLPDIVNLRQHVFRQSLEPESSRVGRSVQDSHNPTTSRHRAQLFKFLRTTSNH